MLIHWDLGKSAKTGHECECNVVLVDCTMIRGSLKRSDQSNLFLLILTILNRTRPRALVQNK